MYIRFSVKCLAHWLVKFPCCLYDYETMNREQVQNI